MADKRRIKHLLVMHPLHLLHPLHPWELARLGSSSKNTSEPPAPRSLACLYLTIAQSFLFSGRRFSDQDSDVIGPLKAFLGFSMIFMPCKEVCPVANNLAPP